MEQKSGDFFKIGNEKAKKSCKRHKTSKMIVFFSGQRMTKTATTKNAIIWHLYIKMHENNDSPLEFRHKTETTTTAKYEIAFVPVMKLVRCKNHRTEDKTVCSLAKKQTKNVKRKPRKFIK